MAADYRFSLILSSRPNTPNDMLDVADALGDAGCTDASVCGHAEGMELLFERSGSSLQSAIESAVTVVERAGFPVTRVELERDAIRV